MVCYIHAKNKSLALASVKGGREAGKKREKGGKKKKKEGKKDLT